MTGPSNPALKDIDDPEFTLSKDQWEEMQLRFDITLDGALKNLSDEDRAALETEVASLNTEAVFSALSALILNHPVEFFNLLRVQREQKGITMQISSDFQKLLGFAEKNT